MPITARIWALTLATRQNGYCAQKVKDSLKSAFVTKDVVDGMLGWMEEGHRVNPTVTVLFTRAIESSSTTCDKNHFTSQVFCAKSRKWLGGVHSFSNPLELATFKRPKKTVWTPRRFPWRGAKYTYVDELTIPLPGEELLPKP